MVAAVVAIAVIAFLPGDKSGSGSSHNAAATGTESTGGSPGSAPSPAPAPSGNHHKRGHHKPAKHHHKAKTKASPSPSPTPKPKHPRRHPHPGPHGVARLTAAVSVSGPPVGGRDARVTYSASNIGNVSTKELSAQISIPAGAVLAHDWSQNGGADGWSCHSGGHVVICQHGPVSKDSQTTGSFSIVVRSRTACGQPVTFSVSGGTPRTEASSSALIQCSGVSFNDLGQTLGLP
jgi:hypothetical protein